MTTRNVVFDFDRTLTHDDTTYAFFAHAAASEEARAQLRRIRALRRLRMMSRARFKTRGVEITLAARALSDVDELARSFAARVRMRHRVTMRLMQHAKAGDAIYVATASLEPVARAVLEHAQLGAGVTVVGSTLALHNDGRITGIDVMCEGRRKLDELWRRHGVTPDVAYTDGRGDLPLVRAAKEAHLVMAGRIIRIR